MTSPLPPHLRQLEAEAMFILREVVAEFERPVMLYSVGKDSSVMLHLALKAFYPAKPPFPLFHVDTTWKFKEMIAFRDIAARKAGMDLIVHINQDGVMRGISRWHRLWNRHEETSNSHSCLVSDCLGKHGLRADARLSYAEPRGGSRGLRT